MSESAVTQWQFGRITRPVTFTGNDQGAQPGRPAGTLVYVTRPESGRSDRFRIRIPGTLLEADVPVADVELGQP